MLRQLQLHRQLAASCAAAYVSYLLTREEMSTNRRNACPEYATFCAYSSFAELLPHASPYVAREMSFAVSGALANRGLTTVRLAWGACTAHLPLPVNRSGSTNSAKVKRTLIRYQSCFWRRTTLSIHWKIPNKISLENFCKIHWIPAIVILDFPQFRQTSMKLSMKNDRCTHNFSEIS